MSELLKIDIPEHSLQLSSYNCGSGNGGELEVRSKRRRAKQSQCEIRNGHETSQTQKEEEEVTAEFSYLSDTDDSAVEGPISQTKDLYILEQNAAAINGSSFTVNGSLLPSHLQSRFRNLKSFNLPKPQTTILNPSNCKMESTLEFVSAEDAISSPWKKRNPDEKPCRKSTTEYNPVSSLMDYPDSWRKSKSP
ncbi:hypothetical protein NL676_020111 [Syzygium grande]|nr:hypothetical protein NL676_020111 [Syzygium grande]